MSNDNSKVKGTDKTKKNAKPVSNQTKAKDLEPCDQPQSQEASHPTVADDACDDGVN